MTNYDAAISNPRLLTLPTDPPDYGEEPDQETPMIVMDIETVPNIPIELALEMAESSGSLTGRDTAEEEARKYAATLPPLAKIVCVGLRTNASKFSFTAQHMTEAEIVKKTLAIIGDTDTWPLVTFSGRTFDLPMIITAAMRHGIPIPAAVNGLHQENRFRPCNHIDVREFLTNFGATKGSMRAWCIGFGLGDPKSHGDGSQVSRLVAENRWDELTDYCLSDCEYTAKLYAKVMEARNAQ